MRKVKLILGNITFEDDKAIIHEIYGVINCESVLDAEKLGDDLVNILESYLIPEAFKGEIINNCANEFGAIVESII